MLTDCDHASMAEENAVFKKAALRYEAFQCKTEEDLITQCKGGEVFINQYAPFTRSVMQALLPELQMVVRYGVGVDNIDVTAARELGVTVCNVPDYGMNEVADQAVALLLALVRKICLMNSDVKNGQWEYSHGIPIRRIPGSTVGIAGFGRIGQTFAKRMQGFDCRLIAYDPLYPCGNAVDGVEIVDFSTLLAEADMISIHCPLSDVTRGLFSSAAFARMKPGAYLVNTARGNIVNEDDLYEALWGGKIAGAALDVAASEPIGSDCRLLTLPNFICTPHIAWYSVESASELKRKVAEEAIRFATGHPVHYALTGRNI
jgi:D-3-phosphoglycerate dehydrogenase